MACTCVQLKIAASVGQATACLTPCAECATRSAASKVSYDAKMSESVLIAKEIEAMARERLIARGVLKG